MAQRIHEIGGSPLESFEQASTDAVQYLSEGALAFTTDADLKNRRSIHCVITVEDAPIRFSFLADPVSGGLGKRVDPGQEIHLNYFAQIKQFRFISDISGNHANLQVQAEV